MLRHVLLISLLILAAAARPAAASSLEIATWNLQWLIAPQVFKPLKEKCAPKGVPVSGKQRRLPCDVAYRLERSTRDFQMLAQYARQLDADIIALQEVDGAEAARLVFPGYDFCFTGRRNVQNNGFAIRNGVPHRCGSDIRELSLDDRVRRGKELTVYPGEAREIRLLSVHLKSGCQRDALTMDKPACRDLARQLAILERWIDEQAAAGRRFAVLGDFNLDLSDGTAAWAELDDRHPPEADLVNAAAGERFINCTPGQRYPGYIDYIVLSRRLGTERVSNSFERVTYNAADSRRTKLSDHCPLAIRLAPVARGR